MRQPRRSPQQWLALFDKQQSSGLSAAEFCKAQNMNLKTWYAKRSDLRQMYTRSGFVRVEREVTTSYSSANCDDSGLQLTFGASALSLPESTDAVWLATLMKHLHQ